MSESWYDTAQVCLNGHPINCMSVSSPEHNRKFCSNCGAETITNCEHCKAPIKGFFHEIWANRPGDLSGFTPRSFCDNCGKPYPWIVRKLKAAQDFADLLEELKPEERELLKKSLDDIIVDTPQTKVAANRVKILAAKVGKAASEQLRELVVDIASETAKKIILEQMKP